MPRPHYAPTGGPIRAAWNTPDARKRHRAIPALSSRGSAAPSRPAEHAAPELQVSAAAPSSRGAARSEPSSQQPAFLPPASRQHPFDALPVNHHRFLLWITACLCLAALLFTLAVFAYRG